MTKRTGNRTRAMTVDVVTTPADAEQLEPEWDDLARRVDAQPFGLPAMALPWWNHLGRGRLAIVTVRSPGGDLVGLAPFHERSRTGLRERRPLGHGVGAIAHSLIAPIKADVAGLLVDALLADRRTVVRATDLIDGDPILRSVRRNELLDVRAVLHDEVPLIELDGIDDAADLLGAPAYARLRKQLARADRDLADRVVTLDVATSPDAVGAAFRRIGPLYDAAEAERPRLHFGRGPHGEFFTEALGRLAVKSQVAVLTLLIDGRPAAFDVYVIGGRVGHAVLGRFDPAMARWSPGHLLLRAGVEWACAVGLNRIDLQLGADPYKIGWSNGVVDTFDVVMARRGSMALARLAIGGSELAHELRRAAGSVVRRTS